MSWRILSPLLLPCFVSCTFSNSTGGEQEDPPTVGFEFRETGTDEQSGMVGVPIVLSHVSAKEISVPYMLLSAGTATKNIDFEIATGTLVFPPGETRRTVPVTIKDDMIEGESAESFDIAIGEPKNADLDQDKAIHTVRISDHILPRVTVGPASTMSMESVPSTLVIRLDKPAEPNSFVVVGVDGGMPFPTSSSDLTLADNTMVTIPTGAMQVEVAIGEKDDALDEEDNETAVFTLRGASTNLVLGLIQKVNHNIVDNDDPPVLKFAAATSNLAENGVTTLVNVQLVDPSGRQVRVDYTRDGADTADNADATVVGSGGTITFDPGETSKNIIVTVNNDTVDEDDESVVINLTNLVNAQAGAAPVLSHTVTIQDNDTATVTFSQSSDSIDEDSNGGDTVTVRLSTQSAKVVQVPFSLNTAMTTATDGDDFTILTGSPLTFNPGTTQITINTSVPSSSPGNEPDEFMVIDLGMPTGGAVLGTPARYSLRITE